MKRVKIERTKMNRSKIERFRKKKGLVIIVISMLCLGVISIMALLIINYYIKESVQDRIITLEEAAEYADVDCILVLGAGVWNNDRPSGMLEDRLIQGIELYKAGISNRLLMSGDHGRIDYDEVNVMKQYAMEAGIPSDVIFMDHAGFSTYESIYRAKEIFQTDKIIIVSQQYHLYRALFVAEKLGIEAYGVSSDLRYYAGQDYRNAREILARGKDFFYTLIKPKPTYLGEAIPVSGNGNITND